MKLRPCRALRVCLSDDEVNDFPAVHTGRRPFISPHAMDAEGTELTQAVFAIDNKVSVLYPSCLDWVVVNVWGSSS